MKKNILYRGSFTGILQLIIATLLTLITIRFFILYLGSEKYGIYAIISIIGNLNIFANFGLNISLIKYISEQGITKESNYDIIVTLTLMILVLIPITLLLYISRYIILDVFLNIPPDLLYESIQMFNFLLISNILTFVGQIFSAVIDASQKVYITNTLQIIYTVFYWVGILISILLDYSLPTIGLSILIATMAWFLINYLIFNKIWGKIHLEGIIKNFNRITKKQLSYSLKIYITNIMGLFFEPFIKLLISKFLGLNEVGFFDITLKIKNQFWGLIGKATSPLLPFIANMKDVKQIGFFVNDLEQKIFYIVLPLLSIIFVSSHSFINLWLGTEVNIIAISIIIIVNSYLIFSSTVLPNYLYLMSKRPNITIIIQLSNVVINSVLFFVFFNKLGYYSVILGFFTAIFVSFIISLYYQNKYLKGFIFKSIKEWYKYILILILVTIIGYSTGYFIAIDILKIIVSSTAIIISTILFYKHLKVFNMEDVQRYFEGNKFIRNIFINLFTIKN